MLRTAFAQAFDATQQDRTAVRYTDRGAHGREGERRQLNRGALPIVQDVVLHRLRVVGRIDRGGSCVGICDTVKGERIDVADLTKERHQRQPHKPAILGNDSLDGQRCPFCQYGDDRLMGGREVADNGDDARNKRPVGRVRYEGRLTVEQRDFGCLENVGSRISLSCLNHEEGFDVAQDREAEAGSRAHVETTKLWCGDSKASLLESDVEVDRRSQRDRIETNGDAWSVVIQCVRFGIGEARVVIDVKVEVDANSLEEIVVERNESNFDRDL